MRSLTENVTYLLRNVTESFTISSRLMTASQSHHWGSPIHISGGFYDNAILGRQCEYKRV